MSAARDILEQRLAKGEISPEEFDSLLAKLSARPESPQPAAAAAAATTVASASAAWPQAADLPKGSYLWGVGGIVMGIVWYSITSNITTDIINECMGRGSSFAFCQENGVKWPLVYVMGHIPAILLGLAGVANLLLPKK